MIKLPGRIIELFGQFRQLNSILNENWRDVASKDFFSNFIDPVNSSWKTFHRQVEEASNSLKRVSSSIESNEYQIMRMADKFDTELHNNHLANYVHCTLHDGNEHIDFLMPGNLNTGSEEGRKEYALRFYPHIDEDTRVETNGMLNY